MRAVLESTLWVYGVLVMCLVGLAGAIIFIISYQRTVGWTWWRFRDGDPNSFGRFLMIWSWTRVGVLGLTVTNALFPPWPGQLPLSFLAMGAFAIHTFVPYRLLRRIHSQPPKEEHHERLHH